MGLNIRDYSLLCNCGSAEFNEDVVGVTPFGAWVLDGATGLNNKNLVSKDSDARWYVNWWNEYLHKNISKDISLKDILKYGIRKIKNEYEELLNGKSINEIDMPSSAISIIKYNADKIEYLLLGDCTLFAKEKDITIIQDKSISKYDNIIFDRMGELPNIENMSYDEIKSSVLDLIIENRLKKNTQDGYWILGFSEEALDNSISGYIEVAKDIIIILTSDGFSCVSDRYNLIEKESLIDIAEKEGIQYIYSKLRNLEDDDYQTIRFPRFKIKDDSSCVYLNIYRD